MRPHRSGSIALAVVSAVVVMFAVAFVGAFVAREIMARDEAAGLIAMVLLAAVLVVVGVRVYRHGFRRA